MTTRRETGLSLSCTIDQQERSTLNGINILNGVEIGDILSNNDVDLGDVAAVKIFDGGKLLVFCK